MICQKCRRTNPDENNYCGHCGSLLPATGRISLKTLIDARLLNAGEMITIKYKGRDISATVLADGKLRCEAQDFEGPLACATTIRGQVCDSWFCWRAIDHETGVSNTLAHYRSSFLQGKSIKR